MQKPNDSRTRAQGNSPSFHVLQRVLFGFADMPQALYFHPTPPRPDNRDASGQHITAEAGEAFDFETFFNTLFVDFWRARTLVRRIGLRLRGSAGWTLEITGVTADGRTATLLAAEIAPGHAAKQAQVFWLPALVHPDDGAAITRVHFTLGFTAPGILQAADYITDAAPVRRPELSVGLCTFNNEARLALTIAQLAKARPMLPEVTHVFVVNQGAPLSDPGLIADLDALGAHYIEQRNLGGAGGFTRTLLEATKPGQTASHHLLMDDDISLDARVIRRALDFLSYATTPDILLGGSMLEMENPGILFEAGANIELFWGIESVGQGLDLTGRENLGLFSTDYKVEYNAWWFSMIPTQAIREHGLPLPMFLHGDDIEYGCRMTRAGIPTVTLPGVAVWHEHIDYKPRDWIVYYDFRNILSNAALYPRLSVPFTPLILLGALFSALLTHRYGTAAALRLAVNDYLGGPRGAFAVDSLANHNRLLAKLAPFPAPKDEEVLSGETFASGPKNPAPFEVLEVVRLFVRRFFQISLPGRRPAVLKTFAHANIHPANTGPKAYARLENPEGTRVTVFRPSRVRLWAGTILVFATTIRFAFSYKRAARQWRSQAADYRSEDYWSSIFADQIHRE